MAVNADEDTEFNDALRKHGILPPKEAPPPSPSPPASPTLQETLDDLTLSDIEELDAKDDEAERMIEQIRRQRLAELKKLQHARFGRVYPIGRDDYTREVTEASKVDVEEDEMKGKGTGVVCFLYKDGIPHSDRAFQHIRTLAERHPTTKFVSIVGDKCIPNLPDARIPMLIIYRNGEVLNQIVSWGADRERRVEELEAILILGGAIIPERRNPEKRRDSDSEEEDESDNDRSSRMRSAATRTNVRGAKNIRGKKQEDSDSDFDL